MIDDPSVPEAWKVSFPAEKEDMDEITVALENLLYPAPLAVSAFEERDQISWRIEILFAKEPNLTNISQVVPMVQLQQLTSSPVAKENWVEKSLKDLKPVQAGRFLIHGSHNTINPSANIVPLLVDAGQAFGTGHHATTKGCLIAIDNIAHDRKIENALDLGCGTGILAVALAKVSAAQILASDIDPVAVEVAEEVAVSNECTSRIRFAVGPGVLIPEIETAAPFDLVVANILAKPLQLLAKDLWPLIRPGGNIILSGLLTSQEDSVLSLYTELGFRLSDRITLEEWSTLVLER